MRLWAVAGGSDSAQGHVRAFMIVMLHPFRRKMLHRGAVIPVVLQEPRISHGTIKSFDVGVLLGLPRVDVVQRNLKRSIRHRSLRTPLH
jgi:hypothetical protein